MGGTFYLNMVIIIDTGQKEIMIKLVAVIVAELNEKIPSSVISGLRIGITEKRGRAHYDKNRITIPFWVLRKSIHYVRYYVCHEIAHLVAFRDYGKNEKHGVNFKAIERFFCASFDVRLVFPQRHHGRAYPIAICGPDGHFERSP